MKLHFKLSCVLIFTLISISSISAHTANNWQIISPNGLNKISVHLIKGKLYYSVLHNNDTLVRKSSLGLVGQQTDLFSQLFFKTVVSSKITDEYSMKIGKRLVNLNSANQKIITFTNSKGKKIAVVCRAYNDGLAFRYMLPKTEDTFILKDEMTSFHIPLTGKTWLMPYGKPTEWSPAYEEYYTNGEPVGATSPFFSGWSFPALFEINKHFVLLSECDLDANFYASHLKAEATNGNYVIEKPNEKEINGLYTNPLKIKGGETSPWRVFICGKSLATIVQSNLIHDLSKKNVIADTSWIKPGRSSWSWWGDHESSKSYQKLTKFIDLAKEMGWEYSLVDANWDIMTDGGTIEDLIKYANEKNISLGLWYNSGGEHNDISERPRNLLNDSETRRAEFAKLQKWGIKLIKVDFFNSDKQPLMKLHHDILKDAADYKIMVDFHGCTLPKGWSRTYPNLVTMEAIRGAEQYAYDKLYTSTAPSHNIISMFTRNVVGPMDYTPVTFSNYDTVAHETSNAHELALSVLIESGIIHFADRVDAYQSAPKEIKNFLKIVPTTWDDTKLLSGYPGKSIVLARKKNSDWFIGGANGENIEKDIEIDLSILKNGKYELQIMKDGVNNRTITTNIETYNPNNPIKIKLLPNGGFTIWAKKIN